MRLITVYVKLVSNNCVGLVGGKILHTNDLMLGCSLYSSTVHSRVEHQPPEPTPMAGHNLYDFTTGRSRATAAIIILINDSSNHICKVPAVHA